jgi:hypothetical protein
MKHRTKSGKKVMKGEKKREKKKVRMKEMNEESSSNTPLCSRRFLLFPFFRSLLLHAMIIKTQFYSL